MGYCLVMALKIPQVNVLRPRDCKDGEAPCVVCLQPVKLAGHPYFVWEHNGGGTAVTAEEAGGGAGQVGGVSALRRNA